jgi:outer membrane receptor for ferrienterochelin and colicin
MKYFILLALAWGVYLPSQAQHHGNHVHGKVMNMNAEPIFSAKVTAPQLNKSVYTDTLGNFYLDANNVFDTLIVSAFGYLTDTLLVKIQGHAQINVNLKPVKVLKTTKVRGKGRTGHIGRAPEKQEVLTHSELKKAACCDLAGCFETQGTVKAVTTNVVVNTKELRILGLSGVYNQVLTDGMPMIKGLSYTYGISAMPGTAVYGIFVSKGTNSVLQGYESMVGQINVIPMAGNRTEKLLVNAYANSFGENQYNLAYAVEKDNWSNYLALHLVNPAQEWDRNNDSFMDVTKLNRILLYNKFKFGEQKKTGLQGTVGFKVTRENRLGGQLGYDRGDIGSTSLYGQSISYFQPELYAKSKWLIDAKKSIELSGSFQYQDQNSYFGVVKYQAQQEMAYLNSHYSLDYAEGDNNFKIGASLRRLNINETIGFTGKTLGRTYAGSYERTDLIPGVYAENILNWRGDIMQLITGFRADHHNEFGWQYTPRALFKYDVSEAGTLRLSGGSGWRMVNMFAENIGLLSSSRDIVFVEKLEPEKSINFGLNYVHNIKYKKWRGYLTTDFYQTRFQNQFFPDYDQDASKAFIANFKGTSVSNAFQFDAVSSYGDHLEFKGSYSFLDVYRVINNEKVLLPFNSRHRVSSSVSWSTERKEWQVDVNYHWHGKQRLPDTKNNPEQFQKEEFSDAYSTFNLQVTKNWKRLSIYGGVENIFDFRLNNPIINAQNPFDNYFDTNFTWGPVRGREIYMGLRYYPFKK